MAVSMRDIAIWAGVLGVVVVGGAVAEGERRSHEALNRYFDDLAKVAEQASDTSAPVHQQSYKLTVGQP